MLRVVESLPLTSDDMHHTRSAHGSFADLLRDLAQSTDFEARGGQAVGIYVLDLARCNALSELLV